MSVAKAAAIGIPAPDECPVANQTTRPESQVATMPMSIVIHRLIGSGPGSAKRPRAPMKSPKRPVMMR
jgi:hypothetical protein